MARYVTVSAVAPGAMRMPRNLTTEERVRAMMRYWENQIAAVLPDRPDVIVLPEACDRYYRVDADFSPTEEWGDYYRVRGNRIRDFFADMAAKNNCYIAYSAARQTEDGSWRNSTQLIGRRGEVEGIYNKSFLVVDEGTADSPCPMKCGKGAEVFGLDFGRVGCVICFDLNFGELRRQYMEKRPELMLFSSMYHGGFVQQQWAYDCHSWFVGAVAGQDCRVINPVGEVVASSTNYNSYVTTTINLDYAVCYLDFNREKFAAAKEKYGRDVSIHDPGKTGAILLSSESDAFSAMDIVKEFEIELMDEYFARNRVSQRERTER